MRLRGGRLLTCQSTFCGSKLELAATARVSTLLPPAHAQTKAIDATSIQTDRWHTLLLDSISSFPANMASHIQKWAEHTHRTTTKRARVLQPVHRRKGGVRASDGDNDHSEEEEEDFEAGLIIPDDGHLSLHLSRHSRSASGHETAMSTSGASSTTGSGALLFSSDSEQQPPEADTDADGDRSRSASVNAGAAGGANEDEDAEDERGSTLKANQLPASFATQLALAKAQAALAKVDAATAAGVAVATVTASSAVLASADTPGQVRNLGRIVTKTSPQQAMDWEEDIEGLRAANLAVRRPVVKQASFTSHISDSGDEDEGAPAGSSGKSKMEQARSTAYKAPVKAVDDDDDIESDFDLPEAVQQVKLSTSNRREPSTASSFFAQGSSTAASSLRRLDANNRGPKSRQASSTDDAKFFADIVLPTYLGGPAVAAGPSQADKSSAKIDLQALLNLKLQRKIESPADSGSPSLSPPRNQTPSRSSLGSGIRAGTTGSLRSRYREAPSEDFEDGLVLDEPAGGLGESTVAHHGSPVRRGGSGFQPRGIQAQRTTSSRGDHLAPLGIPTSSRTARTSTRSRSNDGTALPARPRSPSGLPLSGQSSQQQHDRAPGLRSRPSLSNLSTRSASPAPALPLGRKKSIPFLSAAAADSARPASPQIPARYAQPTRSFLARAHSLEPSSSYGSLTGVAQATMSHQSHIRSTLSAQSGSGYRPASPQVVTANATASALPSSSSLSRLNQPTASSRAKSRVAQGQATPTGADPSGRSSASLGRPLLSSYSHSQGAHVGLLPLARELRRPVLPPRARTRSGLSHEHLAGFGDGTELDGFDDLPINQEKEKRFLRAPRRRESSGGTDITTVAASPGTGPTLRGGRKGAVEPQQQKQLRERMESAPDKLQSNALRRRLANASGGSAHSETSSGASQIQTLSRRGTTGSSAKTASVEARRPRLQLIKGLNAAGLSKGKWSLSLEEKASPLMPPRENTFL